ncbi:MAG: hypothetical protein AABO57_24470 [Acidobacteriota bacterium]
MAVIGFSDRPEEIWCVAGWAFRQVLDDVISQYPEDSEMADEFALSKTQSGLSIDLLGLELAVRVTNAIRQVATGILSGAIRSGIVDQSYGDAKTVEQYQEGLQQLLEAIPSA